MVSDLYLPEWAAFSVAQPWTTSQVSIILDDSRLPDSPAQEIIFDAGPARVFLSVPEIGSYLVSAGSEILVRPALASGMREVRLVLLGNAWSLLCYQRGLLPLHASVVRVAGGAMAFCGPSGAGKSSTAAWLVAHGYELIGDDVCCCELRGAAEPQVWPAVARFKLWGDSLAALGRSTDGLEREHFRYEKYHLPAPAPTDRGPLPLRALYLLDWGDIGLTRLRGTDGLRRFVAAATVRADLLEPLGRMTRQWAECAALLRSVPVWEFNRPREWATIDKAMHTLLDHWL